MDPFLGEIRAVGFAFAPTGWAMCNGQLLPISQNTALFSLLGTFYGGDGKSTFALPDLQAQFPLGAGQGAGLAQYDLGQPGGAAAVTLTLDTIAPHTHSVRASSGPGTSNSPGATVWAQPHYGRAAEQVYATSGATAAMAGSALSVVGGDQPHNNLPPYLVVNFIIAMQGVYPPRS